MKALAAIAAWVEARAAAGQTPPSSWQGLLEDVQHSAYLRRVLEEGREPLKDAPPRANGQPWYRLVEDGRAVVTGVKFVDEGVVLINQARWQTAGQPSEDEVELTFPGHPGRFRLCKLPTDEASGYEAGRWVLIMETDGNKK